MPNEENETPVIDLPDSGAKQPDTSETPVVDLPDSSRPDSASTPTPILGDEPTSGQPINLTEQFMKEHPISQTPPPKKKSAAGKIIGIIIALLVIAGIVTAAIIFIPKLFEQGSSSSNSDANTAREPEKERYSTYEKLSREYQSGTIDVSEYFKQLVYSEVQSDKLDDIYKADDGSAQGTSHREEIYDIIKNNHSKLDKELIRLFVYEDSQIGFRFGDSDDEQKLSENNTAQLAAVEARPYTIHYFKKVIQSKNNNFLIWYTTEGEDKITDEQAKTIADTLENAIDSYSDMFGIKYSFNKLFSTTDAAKRDIAGRVLAANNIPTNAWNKTMSVFVYDTKTTGVYATWHSMNDMGALNWLKSIVSDFAVDDSYLAFPYISINSAKLSNSESAEQVVVHELFHHMTHVYCADKKCRHLEQSSGAFIKNIAYEEATANYATIRVSKKASSDSYLTDHTIAYVSYSNGGLYTEDDLSFNRVYSYEGALYLLSYINDGGGSIEDLLYAHTQYDPYKYLQSKLSDSQLHDTIAKSAYYTLSNNYPSGYEAATIPNYVSPKINKYETLGESTQELRPGAIVYYELGEGTALHAKSDNSLISYILFDESKKEVWHSYDAETDISSDICFKTGKKCYLAYANGDITGTNSVSVTVNNLKEPKKFKTSYENYNLKISMSVTMKGITVSSTATGVMDELHQREHLDVTSKAMGFDIKNEIYTDSHEKVSYTSAPDMGLGSLGGLLGDEYTGWTKSNDANYYTDLGQFLNKLEKGDKGVKKIDDNHYHVTISAKDLQGLVESNGDSTKGVQMPDKDIETDVTVKNGYITKINYDLSGMAGIDKFTANIEFSNYNEAGSVYIPLTIQRDAKETKS